MQPREHREVIRAQSLDHNGNHEERGEHREEIAGEIEKQENVRLPGRRSQGIRKQALESGIVIESDILAEIKSL